ALRPVAGEVTTGKARPVGLLVALVVPVDTAQHPGPWLCQHQVSAFAVADRAAVVVDDIRRHAGEWSHGGAGLRRGDTRERRDHDATRLGLPPRIDDRAAAAADMSAVPDPSLGVDRFTHRPEESETREVVLGREILAPLHEGADGRRGRVEDIDLVPLYDLPPPIAVRRVRRALVHDRRGGVR